jgi:hypothetical protein
MEYFKEEFGPQYLACSTIPVYSSPAVTPTAPFEEHFVAPDVDGERSAVYTGTGHASVRYI